jgi:hypothetical protein
MARNERRAGRKRLGSTTTLGSSGGLLGFYGAAPQAKMTIVGCRSDGSALADLLSKLKASGLINDNTTP